MNSKNNRSGRFAPDLHGRAVRCPALFVWVVGCIVATSTTWAGLPGGTPGDCPPADLQVTLNTGWDQSTGGAVIPYGIQNDDDWDVTVDPNGGGTPRDADVIAPNPAWLTLPNSRWISAKARGVNGAYRYEICWCMDPRYSNPLLSFESRADDEADYFLNGVPIGSAPAGSFNDAVPTIVNVSDPLMFQPGENCLEVEVRNVYGVVTGLNLAGTMTATDGLCCDCEPVDLLDNADTGIDDGTGAPIPYNTDDDEWTVKVDASGGAVPRPAEVITDYPGWDTIPGTEWITANKTGPNGLYVYEKCWCMHEVFSNPNLTMDLLADDQADVFLNGTLIGSTPTPGFQFPATTISTSDPTLFREGKNCIEVHVDNISSVVTGMNARLSITADRGECCDCVDLPLNAEGWWKLDEAAGPTAFESVDAHDGTHVDEFGLLPPPVPGPGKVGGALFFDGRDDNVEVPDHPHLNFGPGEDLSIDAWIKTPAPFAQPIVWKIGLAPTDIGYAFYTSNGLLNFRMSDGTSVICNGSTFVNDDAWHFVAVTVDRDLPGGIRIYLDGVVDAVCDPTPAPGDLTNSQPLFIGGYGLASPAEQFWFEGGIDEVELFRRALTLTELNDLFRAGNAGKCPLVPCLESDLPVCDGECPEGQVCQEEFVGGAVACDCVDEPATCGGSYPTCDGVCDNGEICRLNADGTDCGCDPIPTPCEDTFYPTCDGECPVGETCEQILGTDNCECRPAIQCDASLFPTCDGECPPGLTCVADDAGVADCLCEPEIVEECGDTFYPECDGDCPTGETCEQIPGTDNCECQPEIQCDASVYPVCGGECPPGMTCVADATGTADCTCEPDPPVECGDTFYPTCNGDCPTGETCRNIPGTDNCECQGPPPACGDSLYPTCDGACPVNSRCVKQPTDPGSCSCEPCIIAVPSDDVVIAWPSKDEFRWSVGACALTYNTYRLTAATLADLDGDGLADDYGSCHQSEIIGEQVPESGGPPPGSAHWYLVTGENSAGESTLGSTSGGQERPNDSPCP